MCIGYVISYVHPLCQQKCILKIFIFCQYQELREISHCQIWTLKHICRDLKDLMFFSPGVGSYDRSKIPQTLPRLPHMGFGVCLLSTLVY